MENPSHVQIAPSSPGARPNLAVVLGGIGVRGAASIPLFDFLDQEKIEADLLIGSSLGAVVVAMRAAGYSTAEMCGFVDEMRRGKLYSQIDYRTLVGFAHPKLAKPGIGSALKRPQKQQALYRRIFGARRLEELTPRTLVQTADCIAGEGVLLGTGPVAEAVYAASAMAPDYPPVQIDGRWLVDGAYISPVPILAAVNRQADVIIAMYHQEEPKPEPRDLLEANFNILAAYFGRLTKDQTMLSIELHHHEIILVPITFDEYVGPWDTKALPKVLQAGRSAVERKKREILDAVSNFTGGVRRADQ